MSALSSLGKRLRWALIAAMRAWELRQFRKRLEAERTVLGEQVAAMADLPDAAERVPLNDRAGLALGQVRFLEREIAWQTEEQVRERERFFS